MAVDELPPGFILDETQDTSGLPPGFVLNPPTPEQRVESRIAARPNPIRAQAERMAGEFVRTPLQQYLDLINPIGYAKRQVGNVLGTLGTAGQLVESAIANPALALQRGQPRQVGADLLKGFTGERPGQLGDVYVGAGLPEGVANVAGLLTATALTPGGAEGVAGLTKGGIGLLNGGFQRGRTALQARFAPKAAESLAGLTEKEIAKLPRAERQAYFALRRTTQAQADEAARFQLRQQTDQAMNQLKQAQVQAERQLPSVARTSIKSAEAKLNRALVDQSDTYVSKYNAVLAQSDQVTPFTSEEVYTKLYDEFSDDFVTYRKMQDLLKNTLIEEAEKKGVKISPRELSGVADTLSGKVGAAARQKTRAYTPDEAISDRLRNMILDLVEQRGIDIRNPKTFWKEWVPQRNLALKLQTPTGPRTLINIVKGKDTVREESLQQLQALIEEPLDATTKKAWQQLDSLKQQQVLQKGKAVEQQFLLSQQGKAAKGSEIAKKLRIDQMARRNLFIKGAILSALTIAGAKTPVGKAVLRTGWDVLRPD